MKLNNNIILIRHAENIQDNQMKNDLLPLSDRGLLQAYEAAKLLKDRFDIVICSTSLRAIMTANIISGVQPIEDERLLERGWGNLFHDGKETDEESKIRFHNFLVDTINKYKNKRILLVTHGSLIRLAQDVIEDEALERDRIDNCDIIEYTKDRVKIYTKIPKI